MIYVAMGLLVFCALFTAALTGALFDDSEDVNQLAFGLGISAVMVIVAIAIKP